MEETYDSKLEKLKNNNTMSTAQRSCIFKRYNEIREDIMLDKNKIIECTQDLHNIEKSTNASIFKNL